MKKILIKIKRWWIKCRIDACYKEYESLNHFEKFECSDFFRGFESARRNKKRARKWQHEIDARLDKLEEKLRSLK